MSQSIPSSLFPFQSKYVTLPRSFIRTEVARLHYLDESPSVGLIDKAAQETILCIHGNPTWSFYYRQVIQRFSPTCRVVALDHLGSGLSSRPHYFSYRLHDHIDNLSYFIRFLGLKNITLLVHDWGAAIGLGWAVRHPHLLKRLVILNSAAFNSDDIPLRIRFLRTPLLGEFLMRRLNAFAWPAGFMGSRKGLHSAVRRSLLFPYSNYKQRLGVARFVQDIPTRPDHPSFRTLASIEAKLPTLLCPKLICWGARDFCFHSRFLNRWKEIYPEAKVKVFDDAGHFVLEDETQGVLDAMDLFSKEGVPPSLESPPYPL
ncbi:MAG: alpha/beta fold hydrolase [Oligoflexales bacterium]|nr:alpha/beta fold hydrolase [Oligoflexales bacterium]